jgi:hypothetical protein
MKAEEVITGTLNAIHPGMLVTIESTAEGREGRFYEMSKQSRALQDLIAGLKTKRELGEGDPELRKYLESVDGVKLAKTQYKFFFFGWYDNMLNVIDPNGVPVPKRLGDYFDKIEVDLNIRIGPDQRAWYVTKEIVQGDFMFREHPSDPDEAFFASLLGTYYAIQMTNLRKQGHICKVPYQEGILVDTWWDLGYNDLNSIWFSQDIGREIHLIHYYQNSGEGMMHYADYCRDNTPYRFGRWVAPFDIDVHEYTAGKTRRKIAFEAGINFEAAPKLEKPDQIANVRRILPVCYFDMEGCDKGLVGLDAYRKEWNEKLAVYRDKPLHDAASNPADAFAVFATAHAFMFEGAQNAAMTLNIETVERERALTNTSKGWT